MRPPAFWRHGAAGVPGALLSPIAAITTAITARRIARPGWRAPVPVICCGNPGVGGAGKTPLALEIAARLRARGMTPHFLTRGHGGVARGPLRADAGRHDAMAVGDEPLLLAQAAPCWVGADRAASARAAIAAGADVLVMDDGLQNPALGKDLSLLVIDGGAGFGNGRVLPAGPLREPVSAAAARCQAAVLIGGDETGAVAVVAALPLLRATAVPDIAAEKMAANRVLAFAGIGRPEKFFHMLRTSGFDLVAARAFPDHHFFSDDELRRLVRDAASRAADPVCTPKDHVRLPAAWRARFTPVGMRLVFAESAAFDKLLAGVVT